ncbi:long-chain fatty acid transport protein 4-like [Brevipalpus obovatus]|uniref:long-chain fatty acid transport protein 4-like n=1 Tax=Brevipalpus obovatus TaxID=246614 RepID=UPI003D9EAA19
MNSFVSSIQKTFHEVVENLYHSVYRDIKGGIMLLIIRGRMLWCHWKNLTIIDYLQEQVKRNPNKVAYICDDRRWTFREFSNYVNLVADYFYHEGYRKGDEIALLMESRPEYIGIWLGLAKIGVITALINPNLRGHSLAHCFNTINIKAIIYQDILAQAIGDVKSSLSNANQIKYYQHGDNNVSNKMDSINLTAALASNTETKAPDYKKIVNFKDPLLYLFTSGTTGLPKAAIIKHCRILYMVHGMGVPAGMTKRDVIYCPLPIYHAIGILGTTLSLLTGCSVVLRHRFSATKYWTEFNAHNCNIGIYIGELCRFLLAQPARADDGLRPIRLILSTGLRPAIWRDFIERFSVKRVIEFYGSTEGNSSLLNITGKVGAIGFLPLIFPKFLLKIFYPVTIIKVDVDTGEPVRNHDGGLCMEVKAGDTGMLAARVNQGDSLMSFEGYVDKIATSKKLIADVHTQGDLFFSTGDLVTVDKYRYVYFKDRIGDTYRWRGENVSTNEIESLIARYLNMTDVAVYGVEIPGEEGRVGMAAIVNQNDNLIDLDRLLAHLRESLPNYALPHFIRILSEMKLTGTMKISKYELRQEAFDLGKISDPIFYLDTKHRRYERLSRNVYEDIMNAHHRL